MKTPLITTLLVLTHSICLAQYEYEPSSTYPFGQPNPNAPEQIKDFAPMIGMCHCKSENRTSDGSWAAPVDMTWTFAYLMNGMAVQDQTLKTDGKHSGSIRQYDADSSRWYVHYYSSSAPATAPLSYWTGNHESGKITLYKPQQSPQGIDGFSKLTFYDFNENGYRWIGEWVNIDESIVYPFWKITCKRE
ncbi:hypothetical protein N7E81_02680 [Reichenbachiella carrageenanivorans]|uniref:Secreted protein n=1 Tax=Reichenbachiella carrageenanivorans TaxID=2979869 RepID=A0ABY6D1G2_9BACT|nr:hypothetical protein [Reichenbachiella carrageenanivorans]UXX80011.1 hypothetical protein N7E81_02680 [Reichenbachiella carrageenanivorans]